MSELTQSDERILTIADRSYRYPGDRDLAYRRETGMSPVQAVQRLNELLDSAEALAMEPVLVNRLRRVRAGAR